MKLVDLIDAYDGVIKFNVDKVDSSNGEITDVICFNTDEKDAIKDDVLNADVIKYSVKAVTNTATICVVI